MSWFLCNNETVFIFHLLQLHLPCNALRFPALLPFRMRTAAFLKGQNAYPTTCQPSPQNSLSVRRKASRRTHPLRQQPVHKPSGLPQGHGHPCGAPASPPARPFLTVRPTTSSGFLLCPALRGRGPAAPQPAMSGLGLGPGPSCPQGHPAQALPPHRALHQQPPALPTAVIYFILRN